MKVMRTTAKAKVVRADILASFLKLRKSIQPSAISYVPYKFLAGALSQVEEFLLILICWEYLQVWHVRFCEMSFLHLLLWSYVFSPLFCQYDELHWFSNVKLALDSWNKPLFVVMYIPLYILPDLICYYFKRIFSSIFMRDIGL